MNNLIKGSLFNVVLYAAIPVGLSITIAEGLVGRAWDAYWEFWELLGGRR